LDRLPPSLRLRPHPFRFSFFEIAPKDDFVGLGVSDWVFAKLDRGLDAVSYERLVQFLGSMDKSAVKRDAARQKAKNNTAAQI
jgi:hypothetical protein